MEQGWRTRAARRLTGLTLGGRCNEEWDAGCRARAVREAARDRVLATVVVR